MAGAPQKVDVTLTVAAEHQEAAAALKSGQPLQLAAAPDGGVDCSSANGAPLGRLPAGNCPPLVRGAFEGTIRSIRKAPGGAAGIAAITLRVVSAASPAAAPLQGWDDAPREQPAEEDDFRLPRGSLELLASSAEVRESMRSEQLRTAVAAIDSADRPEQALERALQNPAINAFAEKVLSTIGRGGPEVDDKLAAILSS